MKITFLGTGTSQGVPVIACKCEVCLSKNLKDKRLRSSILIELQNKTIVIDTGPDFRQQMLRENVEKLDAVLKIAFSIPARIMEGKFEPVISLKTSSWRTSDPGLEVSRSLAKIPSGNRFSE